MLLCDRCGQGNPVGALFCNACAAPLATEASAGVRKTVTVLFSDLVGSTSLGDRTDFRFSAEAYRRDGFGDRPAFSGIIAVLDGQPAGYLLYSLGYDTDGATRFLFVIDLAVDELKKRGVQFDTWWLDQGKATALAAEMSGETGAKTGASTPSAATVVVVAAGLGLIGFFVFRRALRRREV